MSSILFEIKNNIAFITLNRPEKFNAFNREMALLLQNKLDECAAKTDVRCVYITGEGKGFCSGQDLSEVIEPNAETIKNILSEQYNPIILKINSLEKPVVVAVNGIAAGAGANIALACDIVLASVSANFIQAFAKIGLIPDCGGTYNLPRLIGKQKASALMMLGDKISATEAERMGMIYKVFEDDVFKDESIKIAEALAQMPTKALAFTKDALQKSSANSLEEQLEIEEQYQQKAAATKDFKEGVQSFLEKRKANFKGE